MRETPRYAIVALVVLAGCTEREADALSYAAFLLIGLAWSVRALCGRRQK